MGKRDYITEILEKKGRLPPESERWKLVSRRRQEIDKIAHLLGFLDNLRYIDTDNLDMAFEFVPELSELQDYPAITYELARYIPIGLIACIEGYFGSVYKNLIDSGSPFREHLAKFDKIPFSLDRFVSIEQHSISLGEFVAHFLPCNSIDDINNNMSTLTGQDFLGFIKKNYLEQVPSLFPETFTGDKLISNIKHIFDLRHMYCHEISPPMPRQDYSWVQSCPRAASEFLLISEYVVQELLSGNEK